MDFLTIILSNPDSPEVYIYIADIDTDIPDAFNVNDIPKEFQYVCTCISPDSIIDINCEYEYNDGTEQYELIYKDY